MNVKMLVESVHCAACPLCYDVIIFQLSFGYRSKGDGLQMCLHLRAIVIWKLIYSLQDAMEVKSYKWLL